MTGASSKQSARVLTWNLERKRPTSPTGRASTELLAGYEPDVMALTEVRTTFPTGEGHALWCEPPRGRGFDDDERKVMIWSQRPWRDIDRIGIETSGTDRLDPSRFISATTDTPIGPLRMLGVCIPWHMAEVTHPIDVKRKPWEQHIRFLERLRELIAASEMQIVVAGDFNQRVPRVKYGNKAAAVALGETFVDLDIVTRGHLDGGTGPGIDHIAVSCDLHPTKTWAWPNVVNGQRLSDHEGAGADLVLR